MPMAMRKEGPHKDQSDAFWCKTDYMSTEESGIQRHGDWKESETDAIERGTVRVRSYVSPTVILMESGGDEAQTEERLLLL